MMMMMIAAPLLAGVAAAHTVSSWATNAPEPMLDGRCDDHASEAGPVALASGLTLYLRQTRDHVWLCYTAPPDSYAIADLRIESPDLERALNLHASAQLGEWLSDDRRPFPRLRPMSAGGRSQAGRRRPTI